MPPVHVVPHILRAGGIPAIIGAVIAVALSWPQREMVIGSSSPFEAVKYHSTLSGSGLELEAAIGLMIGWVILFALAGLAIGQLLVAAGLVKKDELGVDE
jgi:hypothetical protein